MTSLGQKLILKVLLLCISGTIGLGLNPRDGVASSPTFELQTPKPATSQPKLRLIFPGWEPEIPPLDEPSIYLPKPSKPEPLPGSANIPQRYQGTTIDRVDVSHDEKLIALTFDDGPWPDTPKILDILRQYNVRATFFFLGQNLPRYPEIAQQVVKEGHAIGNHTWNHHYKPMNFETAAAEIDNTSAVIERLTGEKTRLFRPPGGILNNGVADYAKSKNYVVVMWSIDTKDYLQPAATILANRVLNSAHSGAIVLMHDGGGSRRRTVEALPLIITGLKQQGYRLVTVPQLLEMAE